MGQQRVELFLDPPGELVQIAWAFRSQQQVQAYGEQALFAALQAFAQSFGVFERDLALGIADAFATQRSQP